MSDFLGRLVERHREEPAIVPRALSRFEITPVPASSPIGETETIAESSSVVSNGTAREPSTTRNTAKDVETEIVRAAEITRLVRERVESQRGLPVEPGPPRLVADERHAAPRMQHDRIPEPTVREARPRKPIVESRTAPSIVPRAVTTAEPRPIAPPPALSAERLASEPNVIRIHIGRVDVRAALVPERPRPVRAAEPSKSMSLDHYLNGKDRA